MSSISRRSFVELAYGTLVSLPVLAGGLVLSPRPAAAEGVEETLLPADAAESNYVVIDVVKPWEISLLVVDITKGVKNDAGMTTYPAIPGAKIHVEANHIKKAVDVVSDEDGIATVDIKELVVMREGEKVDNLSLYAFYGRISISCDGYRTFETAKVYIEGGKGFQVPAYPLDEQLLPYPHQVSLNEWDILYSNETFCVTPENNKNQVFDIVAFIPEYAIYSIASIWVTGADKPLLRNSGTLSEPMQIGTVKKEVTDSQSGVTTTQLVPLIARKMTVRIEEPCLLEGRKCQLPVGASFMLCMEYNRTKHFWPLALSVKKGIVEKPAKQSIMLTPISNKLSTNTAIDIKWPKSVPVVGGSSFKAFEVSCPINVYINPFGLVQITFKSADWGYKSKTLDPDPDAWGKHPLKVQHEQYYKKYKEMEQMRGKASEAYSRGGIIRNIDAFPKVNLTANIQILALAQWNEEKNISEGELAGQVNAGLSLNYTQNFFVGPIPLLISFNAKSNLLFSLAAAFYAARKDENEDITEALFHTDRWRWDYASTGFSLTLSVVPSLSVGVGIRGVASVSIKGKITFSTTLHIPMGTQPSGLPSPHVSAGCGATLSIVIEFLYFTKTFNLCKYSFTNFYDNWSGRDPGVILDDDANPLTAMSESEEADDLANMSFESVVSEMVPITADMLAETTEVSYAHDPSENIFGPGDSEFGWNTSFDWEDYSSEVEAEVGDLSMDYVAYDFFGPEESNPTHEIIYDESVQSESGSSASQSGTVYAAAPLSEADYTYASQSGADYAYASQSGESGEPQEGPSLNEEIDFSTSALSSLPDAGIEGLGSSGGVRPSSNTQLLQTRDGKPIFGSSHTKAVTINSGSEKNIWLFRIASVDDFYHVDSSHDLSDLISGNHIHSGLVATCIDGPRSGRHVLINYFPSLKDVSDWDLHVYDFDVYSAPALNYKADDDIVHIVLLAGKRDANNEKITTVATELVFGYLQLRGSAFSKNYMVITAEPMRKNSSIEKSVYGISIFRHAKELINYKVEDYHCISCLQVLPVYKDAGERATNYDLITFLDRSAPTRDGVLASGAEVHMGMMFASIFTGDDSSRILVPRQERLERLVGSIGDGTVYELVCTRGETENYFHMGYDIYTQRFTAMLRGSEKCYYFLFTLDATANSLDAEGKRVPLENALMSLSSTAVYDPCVRLVPCGSNGRFLTSYPTDEEELEKEPGDRDFSKWKLHEARWDKYYSTGDTPKLTLSEVGPSDFNIVNFAVSPDGEFIFWPQKHSATENRVYSADVNFTEDVKEVPASYTIAACRIRDGKFSDPFIVAELDHDTDYLSVLDTSKDAALEMLHSEYVDTGKYDANGQPIYYASRLWYTSVPRLRCATATGCKADRCFVVPGMNISFDVAVRNDGNVFLSGCSLTLCQYNEETDSYKRVEGMTQAVTFNEQTICESQYNPRGDDGKLTDLEPDYALAPGKSSVYKVEVVVPEGWTGRHKVLFVAHDGVMVGESLEAQSSSNTGLMAAAEDETSNVMEYHIEPGEYNVIETRVSPDRIQDSVQRHMETLVIDDPTPDEEFALAPLSVVESGGTTTDDGGTTQEASNSGTTKTSSGTTAGGNNTATGSGTTAGGNNTATGSAASKSGDTGATTPRAADTSTRITTASSPSTASTTTSSTKTATTGSTTSSTKASALPDTSDRTNGSALGAGIALLGGAILAYERRRAKNEGTLD